MRRSLFLLTFVSCLVLFPKLARAQVFVTLELKKTLYVAYDPVNVVVSVSNRSGRDINLAGPNGRSWLTFNIKSLGGHHMTPRAGDPVIMKPVKLANGKTKAYEINVSKMYPLNSVGTYRIFASVYHPPTGNYFDSNARTFNIDDAREFWSRVVGQGGKSHRYSLLNYRGKSRTELYFRYTEVSTGIVKRSYSLGRIVHQKEPMITIDGKNKLHTLYLSSPREWTHAIVNPNGTFNSQKTFTEEPGNRPTLKLQENGTVYISGGVSEEERAEDKRRPFANQTRVRKLSDRPPILYEQ